MQFLQFSRLGRYLPDVHALWTGTMVAIEMTISLLQKASCERPAHIDGPEKSAYLKKLTGYAHEEVKRWTHGSALNC